MQKPKKCWRNWGRGLGRHENRLDDHHRPAGDPGDRLVLPEDPAVISQGHEVRGVTTAGRRYRVTC